MAISGKNRFAQVSVKHLQVDKAMTTVLVLASIAAFTLVFSLFASKSLIALIGYQDDVKALRDTASKTLKDNVDSANVLLNAFIAFDSAPESRLGTPDKNSKLVLDSLPSKYDFPALVTSLDGIVAGSGMTVESINGTDEELTALQSSLNPTPVDINFELSASGNYESVQKLLADLGRSIRPFSITSIEVNADDGDNLKVTITAKTAYQPGKELGINSFLVDKNGKLQENSASTSSNSASQTDTTTGVTQ